MNTRWEHIKNEISVCWESAFKQAPRFCEDYLTIVAAFLEINEIVLGDEFTKVCRRNGLDHKSFEGLHHNVWASGVKAVENLGWITRIDKVEPQELHNHMPTVTRWASNLYRGPKVPARYRIRPSKTSGVNLR